ncbi:very-long-chain enoyl-CoA reductase isoform X4 [Prionailurus bengalensis]|uniref:very-long-chain enoyl-CoA reductase isoform X4 n=1 Tax=Prionailurus bengalensis TaxID=37029 RepID=UPI001CA8D9BC|nr:very-long-chain enoyl-CoA reductase isoform X4 [Prionailurus bengalensis]
MKHYEVEILDAKTREKLCFLDKVEPHATIAEIKNLFTKTHPQWYPARQSLRLDPKGKSLKDEDVLQKLPVGTTATLYFRDLGAQISWVTVFLTEYAGPLFIYLLFYFRVPFIYGHKYDFTSSRHTVVHLACICHSFHYIKRLLETLFVHRFSHGTMPLRNIFKNCTYYWGFAAWMAYYINHPLYTPPSKWPWTLPLPTPPGLSPHRPPLCFLFSLWSSAGETGPRHLRDLPAWQLFHPHGPAGPAASWVQDQEDPIPHQEPLHLALPAGVLPQLYVRGGILDWLCHHDTVSPSGPLLPGGLHSDDHLGQGQAPQLPEGVPGLPASAHAHHPLPALSRRRLPGSTKPGSSSVPAAFRGRRGGHHCPALGIKPACPCQTWAQAPRVSFRGGG